MKAADILSDVSHSCIRCGTDIFDDATGLCEDCKKQFVFNNGNVCLRCGTRIGKNQYFCNECNYEKIYFDRAFSAFVYDGAFLDVIYAVKFGGKGALCKVLANYLAYLAVKNELSFDVVCYVPMSKSSLKKRGYNQARLLAESFCDIMQVDCLSDVLVKTRETVRQEALGKAERKENLKNAYAVTDKQAVCGKTVLLIDDVKTTGATLNNCAKALKKVGAQKVYCLTLASREEHFLSE